MNSFGHIFRLTTFGESHGPAIGGVVDGMPSGTPVDVAAIQAMLDRRRPGQSDNVTRRRESDKVTLLSGVFEGVATGAPIGFTIANTDMRSADYEAIRHAFRPGHADYTYTAKYGLRDYRGGGRASGRETAARVVGGALAMMMLKPRGISITARALQVGGVDLAPGEDYSAILAEARSQGDTVGAVIGCTVSGLPVGLGEPVFDKLQARLAAAMMSIPAAKGFDYGMGFAGAAMRGSEVVDVFAPDGRGGVTTLSNHSGGIQGGISNGQDVYMRVAFKPIATMMRPVETVDDRGCPITLHLRGRHDVSVAPRVIPVVEAMAALVIADAVLLARL